MSNKLTRVELKHLIEEVFPHLPGDKKLTILVDLPDDKVRDNPHWSDRRDMAASWSIELRKVAEELGLERVELLAYRNVGSNNADFPDVAFRIPDKMPSAVMSLSDVVEEVNFDKALSETQLILAPTQFSATAPLKIAAKKYGFRAATMPGFSAEMIPALRIDYGEVNRRCVLLKEKLDQAISAIVIFRVNDKTYEMFFDLRFRQAHASSGRFPEPGAAGNLPSGETYIVPYEGELDQPSKTAGTLPVQFDDGIVFYEIAGNKAKSVHGDDPAATREAELLAAEPAYGNLGEFAFGILADFGLKPIGVILLDEKLGFHVAFGRSDHFGGAVGPKDFSSPQSVVHIDRVYIPETQPRVLVEYLDIEYENGRTERIMDNGQYVIF